MKFRFKNDKVMVELFNHKFDLEMFNKSSFQATLTPELATDLMLEFYKAKDLNVVQVDKRMPDYMLKFVKVGSEAMMTYLTTDRYSLSIDMSKYRNALDKALTPQTKIVVNHKNLKVDVGGVLLPFSVDDGWLIIKNVSDTIDKYLQQNIVFTSKYPHCTSYRAGTLFYRINPDNGVISRTDCVHTQEAKVRLEYILNLGIPHTEDSESYIINGLRFPKGGRFTQIEPSKNELIEFISFMSMQGYTYNKTKRASEHRSIIINENKVQVQTKYNTLVYELNKLVKLDISITEPTDKGFILNFGKDGYHIKINREDGYLQMFGKFGDEDLQFMLDCFSQYGEVEKCKRDANGTDGWIYIFIGYERLDIDITIGKTTHLLGIKYSDIENIENVLKSISLFQMSEGVK